MLTTYILTKNNQNEEVTLPRTKTVVKKKGLSKGELRKLTALRKSLGEEIADEAFAKWYAQQKADEKESPIPTWRSWNELLIGW